MRLLYFLLLILLTFCLRTQEISKGLPYFYDEDEAHHYNRVVSMVQRGTFNPEYFLKPSLHFYLRMPVVAAGFLWSVRQGHIRSIKEINTKDESGVGGYAFNSSHPGITKWNRIFSLFLSVLSVGLVYLIALRLEISSLISFLTAALCAFSPALIGSSAFIGVDALVMFFCLACTYFALLNIQTRSGTFLFLSSIMAGLAIGSKYNALPIMLVPMLTAFLGINGIAGVVWAFVLSTITFFLTTPYLFSNLPLFLDHLAYEIWHYKIAGHQGNSAEPGLAQAKFYFNWFYQNGFSIPVIILSILGLGLTFLRDKKLSFVFLTFPVFYFLLMIDQKANFTRNMLVMLPYLAILTAVTVSFIFRKIPALQVIALLILIGTVAPKTYAYYKLNAEHAESRNQISELSKTEPNLELAIDNRLQPAYEVFKNANNTKTANLSEDDLYLKGFDRLIKMTSEQTRIINNPDISIIDLNGKSPSPERRRLLSTLSSVDRTELHYIDGKFVCPSSEEKYCWLNSRISEVKLKDLQNAPGFSGINGVTSVTLKIFSPWNQDKLILSFSDFLADIDLGQLKASEEKSITINLPYQELKDAKGFFLSFPTVKRPHAINSHEPNKDTRRLGVGILSIQINQR